MIIGWVLVSVAFGAICGFYAFLADFGVIQSLGIYVAAGQIAFVTGPLIAYIAKLIPRFDPEFAGQ